jgi:pyrimidine-specific ribonucleoside hydrolase
VHLSTHDIIQERYMPQTLTPARQPVIIDTDMAPDDWLAILYLLQNPGVEVRAITVTGTGEAHCGPGTRNALDLLALAGCPDVPVACGRATPLAGDHAFPDFWRDLVDNLAGLALPPSPHSPAGVPAVDLLTQIVETSSQPVHVLALGPLTNLGEALQTRPALAQRLAMITIMGGAVHVPGNVGTSSGIDNETAEWNIYIDPLAANLVLASGAPVTLVPLDATNDVPITPEFVQHLAAVAHTPRAQFAGDVLVQLDSFIRTGHYYFWDPLAAVLVTHEDVARYQTELLRVVEAESRHCGRTQVDAHGYPVRVAVAADRERFEWLLLDQLTAS